METQVFDYDLEDDAGRRLACAVTVSKPAGGAYTVQARLAKDDVTVGSGGTTRHAANEQDAWLMARHLAACMRQRCETREAAGYLRRISEEDDEGEEE